MIFQRALRRELVSTAGAVFTTLFTITITVMLIKILGQAAGGKVASQDVIALIGFAGGYILWYRLLVRNRIDQLLPFTLLMPPVGVTTGVLWFGEPLRTSLIGGGMVILIGLAVVVWPTRRAAARG